MKGGIIFKSANSSKAKIGPSCESTNPFHPSFRFLFILHLNSQQIFFDDTQKKKKENTNLILLPYGSKISASNNPKTSFAFSNGL